MSHLKQTLHYASNNARQKKKLGRDAHCSKTLREKWPHTSEDLLAPQF